MTTSIRSAADLSAALGPGRAGEVPVLLGTPTRTRRAGPGRGQPPSTGSGASAWPETIQPQPTRADGLDSTCSASPSCRSETPSTTSTQVRRDALIDDI